MSILETMMDTIESSLIIILENQQTHTNLLQKLVNAQGSVSLLDDNKKGEISAQGEQSEPVNVQISKVLVPAITLPLSPTRVFGPKV